MVAHLTPGMATPIEVLSNLAKYLQPLLAISVREINVLSPVPTRSDMIQTICKLNAQRSRHGCIIAWK
jgi:hypothetical protein